MQIPNYSVLFVIMICIFMASTLSILFCYGALKAEADPVDNQKFIMKFISYIFIWAAIVMVLSYTEFFDLRTERGRLLGPFIVITTLLANISLGRSKIFGYILDAIPTGWLAAIQVYRVIGLVFLLMLADNLLSSYFAFSTGWGDIIVGLTAPITGYFLLKESVKYAYLGIIWCIIGISDLILVLFKALTSAPGDLQIAAFELPTIIIGVFPFPIIPLLVVPISLTLHIQLIRKIQRQKITTPHSE